MSTNLQVSSVRPTSIPAGMEVVFVTQRESKEKKVEEANRLRCILIPELSVTDVPSKFQMLILDTLRRIAKDQLSSLWEEAGNGISEVPGNIWSVDSLLAYNAKVAESKRLSKETLAAFWQESELRTRVEEKKNDALTKSWKDRILSLAAPALDLTEDQCTITIAAIGKSDKDMQSPIAAQMIERLQARINKIKAQQSAMMDEPI